MRLIVVLALISAAVVALRLARVSMATILEVALFGCGAMIVWAGLKAMLAGLWVAFGVAMLVTALWRLQRRLRSSADGKGAGT